MNSLNSSKGDLDHQIQDVLQKSIDCLRNSYKELFFFVAESKDMVRILGDDLYAKSGITTLINICLLTDSPDTRELLMHNLLQDMGRKIVFQENKDPAKRRESD
ncbi:hypothetical protein L1987_87532 [Smallanthus sonchifolius]|nr:hypothetical protein L1987_87532 [Smallanthus sonchifolius]